MAKQINFKLIGEFVPQYLSYVMLYMILISYIPSFNCNWHADSRPLNTGFDKNIDDVYMKETE